MLADDGKQVVLDEALAIRVLTFIHQMAAEGLMVANVDPSGGVALFQGGDTGLYWEGEWNVNYLPGSQAAVQHAAVPGRVRQRVTQADSHTFVLPRQRTTDPEKVSMALTMIRSLLGHSLDLGRGRPHPGLAAHPAQRGVQEAPAPVELRVGRRPRRL